MLDYLIPIAIAVVGIVVMMFIFQSISKADVDVAIASTPRKPRSKKAARPSRKYSEDVLDIATEQLIAREVAGASAGMATDTKSVAPTTLDSIRSRRHAKEESQHTHSTGKLSERQKQAAKDHGFTIVEKQKPAVKQQQQRKQQRLQEQVASTEDLEKKLSLFFKSSGNRKAKEGGKLRPKSDDNNGEPASSGGTVTMKGDIGGAKGWPFKEPPVEQQQQQQQQL